MPQLTPDERRAELRNRFADPPADEATGPLRDEVRKACLDLALHLDDVLPEGRHKSIALTHVEEAWWAAKAAVACDPVRTEPPAGMERAEVPDAARRAVDDAVRP